VIATKGEGEGPDFQIHNNDGTDPNYEWGTWLYSPWGPTIDDGWCGWHSSDDNTLVADLDWVTCTGDRYAANNPEGVFTITIAKDVLDEEFHWALYLAIGSGFSDLTYEQMYVPGTFAWDNPIVGADNYIYQSLYEEFTSLALEPGVVQLFLIKYVFPVNIAGDYSITTVVNVP